MITIPTTTKNTSQIFRTDHLNEQRTKFEKKSKIRYGKT